MLEKQAVASGWAACWAVGCAGESSDAIRAIQTARAEQRNTAMLLGCANQHSDERANIQGSRTFRKPPSR